MKEEIKKFILSRIPSCDGNMSLVKGHVFVDLEYLIDMIDDYAKAEIGELKNYVHVVDDVLLTVKPINEWEDGDVFLWRSGSTSEFSVHIFHSDAGYGIKTYTDFNPEDGSSLLVNYAGVCGILNIPKKS